MGDFGEVIGKIVEKLVHSQDFRLASAVSQFTHDYDMELKRLGDKSDGYHIVTTITSEPIVEDCG